MFHLLALSLLTVLCDAPMPPWCAQALSVAEARLSLDACYSLSYLDRTALIRRLGKRKRFLALKMIAEAEGPGSEAAVLATAKNIQSEKVIEYCKSFRVDSGSWCAAFFVLNVHPKATVIPYIKEIAKSPAPHLRAYCYMLCKQAAWDDIIDEATADSSNATRIVIPNAWEAQTLGEIAESYISLVRKKKKTQER